MIFYILLYKASEKHNRSPLLSKTILSLLKTFEFNIKIFIFSTPFFKFKLNISYYLMCVNLFLLHYTLLIFVFLGKPKVLPINLEPKGSL